MHGGALIAGALDFRDAILNELGDHFALRWSASIEEATAMLMELDRVDLVIADIDLAGGSSFQNLNQGVWFLQRARSYAPFVARILLARRGDEMADTALQVGVAHEVIEAPWAPGTVRELIRAHRWKETA